MTRTLAIGSIVAMLALAGCGGSSSKNSSSSTSSSASGGATTQSGTSTSAPAGTSGLQLAADQSGQLNFDKTSLSTSAGQVTIKFSNAAPVGHNLTIASSGGSVVGATPTFQGGTKALTVQLKPGTNTFYCSVPGHRQAGMQGTLVVK